MSRERAQELLKLGGRKANYINFMTNAEIDMMLTIQVCHHEALLRFKRGVK